MGSTEPCRSAHHQMLRRLRLEQADEKHTREVPQYLKDIMRLKPPTRATAIPRFVPHVHHDIYYSDYVRNMGKERADELKRLHEESYALYNTTAPAAPEWKPGPEHYEHPAIQKLQKDYTSQGKRPPIDAQIVAHKEAGYPESWLVRMLKNHDKRVREQPENDEWFERVMGPYGKKKETVPKPKTLKQIFKIKEPKFVMPDDEDDE